MLSEQSLCFCGLFWVISHTHRVYVYFIAVGSCTAILLDTWRNMGQHMVFILCFFSPYHYLCVDLWIDHEVNISSYWCMEFHGCPPIFPPFFGGLAMLYQFPPKVLKPSEELGLPVAPRRHPQRIRRGSPKVFLGWGGATQISGSFGLRSFLMFFCCWVSEFLVLESEWVVVGCCWVRIDVPSCRSLGALKVLGPRFLVPGCRWLLTSGGI